MPKRLTTWVRRILLGLIVLGAGGWLAGAWLLSRWTARPPPLPADTAILRLRPEVRGGKTWLGQSWAGWREGLRVVRLKGSPFEIGYAQGALLQDQMHTLENEFMAMIRGYVPQDWKLAVLKWYVIYRNRNLSDHVSLDSRLQIYGTTLGCRDIHPEEGSFYNRMLNYHAAHDISYMMIDNPLVSRAGCTSFGAWGAAAADGHLITGRNFDWEAAEVFSRDRVVILCEPDQGIPFISLAWAGMAGVVSGMNRAGISVTINGAPSSLPGESATPVAMIARDILQTARNLDEALAILRASRVFVSTLWLVGSRADGRFIVVEKTPAATRAREAEGDSIVCANHFQTSGFAEDARNRRYMEEATSVPRSERMTELLGQARGTLDAARAASMLRDRKLPGGAFAGNGHRAALNAFIATHATVMDLTDGIFWAASPPNQLGAFVAFDVSDFDRELPGRALSADGALDSGDHGNERLAQTCLAKGREALGDGDARAALQFADQAESLNPGFYRNATLRGRALLALGRRDEAARAFESARAGAPAFLEERRELEALWRQTQAMKP